MKQKRFGCKRNSFLSLNKEISKPSEDRLRENGSMPDKETTEENNETTNNAPVIQSDEVSQPEASRTTSRQSQESFTVEKSVEQQTQSTTMQASNSSFWKDYFEQLLYTRYRSVKDPVLFSARIFCFAIGLFAILMDTLVFCNVRSESGTLKFLYGLTFVFYEIAAMLYASGAAVYGATLEAPIFLVLVIVNCILAHCVWNCDNYLRKRVSILWIIKIIFLIVCEELTHQNFRNLENYKNTVIAASRYVLRQVFLFTLTVLILITPGLKTVYKNSYLSPNVDYEDSCGIVEFYSPKFNTNDTRENDLVAYISAREELRILRNFVYFHIGFYAMFNEPFLNVSFDLTRASYLRFLILVGFFFLTLSYMWSNINPFGFVNIPKFYLFDILEMILALLLLIMLAINLSKWHPKAEESIRQYSGRITSASPVPQNTTSGRMACGPMCEKPQLLHS